MEATKWWASLSINQMKELRNTHRPHSDWWSLSDSTIATIWTAEGKPSPQELIPVG